MSHLIPNSNWKSDSDANFSINCTSSPSRRTVWQPCLQMDDFGWMTVDGWLWMDDFGWMTVDGWLWMDFSNFGIRFGFLRPECVGQILENINKIRRKSQKRTWEINRGKRNQSRKVFSSDKSYRPKLFLGQIRLEFARICRIFLGHRRSPRSERSEKRPIPLEPKVKQKFAEFSGIREIRLHLIGSGQHENASGLILRD